MMKVNTNIIISGNNFSGFLNYNNASFSASYAGGTIGSGSFVGPIRASTPLNNANAVSQVQVQYVGLDTFTRLLQGVIVADYPTAVTATYQIETFNYFSNGTLFIDSYIINEGGSVTVPAITFQCRAFLYVGPA